MSEVGQELLHELLRRFHQRADKAERAIRDSRSETNSIRLVVHAHQGDINNIYSLVHQLDDRIERIEQRLELRELAEAQTRFEPHP
jgi:chromosome segregation ATPase